MERIQGLPKGLSKLQCTHMLGASRGLLCDSSAVLFYTHNQACNASAGRVTIY